MSRQLDLIADVGGTNARFALVDRSSPSLLMQSAKSLPTADFASLQHAAEHYLESVQQRPRRAAIAVASPVAQDEIRLTNRAWSFSKRELRVALNLDSLIVLNDFGAVGHAIPGLSAQDRVCVYGPDSQELLGPVSVLGPGTGLGVALLARDSRQHWSVIETEGGHVSFAPLGEEEHEIARWMTAKFGRTSNERVLCGAGLSHIDAVLAGLEPSSPGDSKRDLRDPAQIVRLALDGHDLSARRTLARFCAVLGSVAGDTALIHGARTVMIAGGIVPRFIPFLRSSAFRERFLAKGRFAAYLEQISVYVITHPQPGLLGAAMAVQA